MFSLYNTPETFRSQNKERHKKLVAFNSTLIKFKKFGKFSR